MEQTGNGCAPHLVSIPHSRFGSSNQPCTIERCGPGNLSICTCPSLPIVHTFFMTYPWKQPKNYHSKYATPHCSTTDATTIARHFAFCHTLYYHRLRLERQRPQVIYCKCLGVHYLPNTANPTQFCELEIHVVQCMPMTEQP